MKSELRAQGGEETSSSSDAGCGGEPQQPGAGELASGAELVDRFFDAAPVGLALLDPELRLIRINRLLAQVAEAHEITPGQPIAEALSGFATPELLAEARRVLATDEASRRIEIVVSAAEPAEAPRTFVETCHAIRGSTGVVGLGLVVREVTQRRRQEEFQERVLGIVGHDLRSPLAAVRISAQLLRRALTDPRQTRLLAVVEGATRRMQRIVEDLLDYTQVRVSGGIPIRPRGTDVAQVCREVVGEALAADPARNALCEGEGDPTAEVDPDRLGQALANVVGNAFRYGAAERAVEVRWHGEPGEVVVDVTNHGPTIPPELLGHVFEPFRRGVHQGGEGGLGLGLFIARHVVGAHGGTLIVRSEEDETCFTVRLPRRRG